MTSPEHPEQRTKLQEIKLPKSEHFFNVVNIRQDDGQHAEDDRARPLLSDQLPGEQQGEPRGKQGMEAMNKDADLVILF